MTPSELHSLHNAEGKDIGSGPVYFNIQDSLF